MRALKRLLGRKGSSVEVSESRGVRTLHLGGEAIQSAMRLSAPDRLELAYTRAMMAFLLFAPEPREILMVGLGGGSIARFIHERLPSTRITVLELSPKVVAAARTFFGLPADDRRLKVIVGDGAEHVARAAERLRRVPARRLRRPAVGAVARDGALLRGLPRRAPAGRRLRGQLHRRRTALRDLPRADRAGVRRAGALPAVPGPDEHDRARIPRPDRSGSGSRR